MIQLTDLIILYVMLENTSSKKSSDLELAEGTGNQENNIAIPAVLYNETAPGLLDKPKRSKIILHSECSMAPIPFLY